MAEGARTFLSAAMNAVSATEESDFSWRDWRPLAILACGSLFRLIYLITFKPWWCGDSSGYSLPYFFWIHGYFTNGERAPVYPFFLGFAQWLAHEPAAEVLSPSSAEIVRDLQCVFGLLAACLVYYTLRALRVRTTVAFIAGLFFSATALACNVEMAIVTPALSLFSLVLGSWLYTRMMVKVGRGESAEKLAVVTGVWISLAALLRPDNLVFFAVIVLATAVFAARSMFIPSRAQLARRLLIVSLLVPISAAPLLLAWMTCNYIGTGRFRMTNMMGWCASVTAYNMFGRVDAEDQVLGRIMHRYYVSTNQHGITRDYIWQAMPEIKAWSWAMPFSADDARRSKLGAWVYNLASDESRRFSNQRSVALGDYVKSVSWKLIRKNPSGYARNIVNSFLSNSFDFTPRSSLGRPDETNDPRAIEGGTVVKNRFGWKIAYWMGMAETPFLTVFYLVTLAYVLASPLILLNGGNEITTTDVAVTALALGTVGAIVAYCLVEAYYSQYGIPYVGVLVICAAYAVDNSKRWLGGLGWGRSRQPSGRRSLVG
jgi:hypothetical protein